MRHMMLLAAGVLVSGCASLSGYVPAAFTSASFGPPKKMLLLLAPMASEDNGAKRQGMLCRVYFSMSEEARPMTADGELVVTAWDQKFPRPDGRPGGVYAIKADRLPNHLRSDIIGSSYVFWFPYDPAGPTQLMVQAAFKATTGEELESNTVALNLAPVGTVHPAEADDYMDMSEVEGPRSPSGNAIVRRR